MKNAIIAILVVAVLALGFIVLNQKKPSLISEPWLETEPVRPSPTPTNPTCTPSIVVSSPAAGSSYTTGQSVTVNWTACGVAKVNLGLVSGGKDYGMISQAPVSSATGSYQWTATNPGKGFTGLNTNSYQIVVSSDMESVMAKSGVFTVTTPEPQGLSPHFLQVLVNVGKVDRITKFTYNGNVYYSATDDEVVALDGGSRIYNSSGVVIEGCGAMGPEAPAAICKTQNRSNVQVIYTR